MIDRNQVIALAEERLSELDKGCYLVDVQVDSANRINVEIDHETRGISVDECVSVSRNIEHNLDREKEDFSLQVGSPGLTESLKHPKQYRKFVGKKAKLKTIEGERFEGEIKSATDSEIEIETKFKQRVGGRKKKEWITETYTFSYDQIKETKIVIEFK